MKKIYRKSILLLFLVFIFSNAQAQFPYTLIAETDTYEDLEGPTELTAVGDFWDDPEFSAPIGFDFEFFGNTYTEIRFVGLGGILAFEDIYTSDSVELLIPYLDDLMDIENFDPNTQSNISYTTEGNAGQRIFKLEWKNVGFYESTTANNQISFQMWLYETSYNIEFRFGPGSIPDPSIVHENGGPVIGMIQDYNINAEDFENFWVIADDPANPIIDTVSVQDLNNYTIASLNTHPADGQVYRLVNIDTDVFSPEKNLTVKVYPTLVMDEFFVEVAQEILDEQTMILVVNNLGQTIFSKKITNAKERLDASAFPKGIYYVSVINEEGRGVQKIIKN